MTNKKIHLIGIGGINMSAIALLLKTKNNIVSTITLLINSGILQMKLRPYTPNPDKTICMIHNE